MLPEGSGGALGVTIPERFDDGAVPLPQPPQVDARHGGGDIGAPEGLRGIRQRRSSDRFAAASTMAAWNSVFCKACSWGSPRSADTTIAAMRLSRRSRHSSVIRAAASLPARASSSPRTTMASRSSTGLGWRTRDP